MNLSVNGCLSFGCSTSSDRNQNSAAEAIAEFPAKQLTDHLDKEAAIVNQPSLSMNSYVHVDKQHDSVQVADEQSFIVCSRDSCQWASTAVVIPD